MTKVDYKDGVVFSSSTQIIKQNLKNETIEYFSLESFDKAVEGVLELLVCQYPLSVDSFDETFRHSHMSCSLL